jgi:hypothetical protein
MTLIAPKLEQQAYVYTHDFDFVKDYAATVAYAWF